jgi:omega-amidase
MVLYMRSQYVYYSGKGSICLIDQEEKKMKLAVVQMDVEFALLSQNQQKVKNLLESTVKENPDVIVLPETWNLGFFPDNSHALAEADGGGSSIALLKEWAKHYHVNIVAGSVIVKKGELLYNRAFIINREGEIINTYDKIHLFSPSGEDDFFQAGDQLSLFEIDGVKCGIMICYDLRFPELSRSLALHGAQLLFVPAQWPHPRVRHWLNLSQARAIENQMYVIACNACGKSDKLHFCGHSVVIDPFGEMLGEAAQEEKIIYVEINPDKVTEIRNQIPVFRDRKPNAYSL